MNSIASGTVLITGPTGGLGKAATLAIANRPAPQRPDLLLVGRAGKALSEVTAAARAAGATVQEIGCDLARLADVRNAGQQIKHLLDAGAVRPLRGLVANAGVSVVDTHNASADGYELTFAVNYLAHAQLIGDLLDSLVAPARVVLLGSNTYHQNIFRRMLRVAPADWRDPIELAHPTRPAGDGRALRDRLFQLQTRDPLLRARIATSRTEGDQRHGVRAGIHAGHRTEQGPRPGHTTNRALHRADSRRVLADALRPNARLDRLRRRVGAPARRRLRRQRRRARSEAVRKGPYA